MGVNVQVWGPAKALLMLGETGRDCNVVVLDRDDNEEDELYPEIMNWAGDTKLDCVIMPEIQNLDIRRVMLVFRTVAGWPSQVRTVNDGYMRLKLTYSGHERISSWEDSEWVKCTFTAPQA